MDGNMAGRIRTLCAGGLDWSSAMQIGKLHGLTPLMYRHLSVLGPEHFPRWALEQLRRQATGDRVRSLQLAAHLRSIVERLMAAGIPAIAFKGPTLAISLYGDQTLRRFTDLDIFVRRGDVLACKRLLLVNGYRPRFALTRAQEMAHLRSDCEYNFDREHGRITVEVHWDVAPRSFSVRFDHERLWDDARSMPFNGGTVRVPAPEDQILMLSVHGAKHIWERLAWICDMAQFLRAHPALDWEKVLADARARGCERMVLLALSLAADLLDAPLPGSVRDRLRKDQTAIALTAQVETWLRSDAIPPAKSLAAMRVTAAMRERWVDRVRYLVRTALTPTIDDWAWVGLPAPLFFLYYVLRPLRLAIKYWPRPRTA